MSLVALPSDEQIRLLKWPNNTVLALLGQVDRLDDPEARKVLEDAANALAFSIGMMKGQMSRINDLQARVNRGVTSVLHAREDYDCVMAEVEQLMPRDPPRDSPEGQRLELLALLAEDYETRMFAHV